MPLPMLKALLAPLPQLASIIVDLKANPSAIRIFLAPWML